MVNRHRAIRPSFRDLIAVGAPYFWRCYRAAVGAAKKGKIEEPLFANRVCMGGLMGRMRLAEISYPATWGFKMANRRRAS